MILLYYFFLWINPLTYVSEVNHLKNEGKKAYKNNDFTLAVYCYSRLEEDFKLRNENIYLNLAHSYFNNRDAEKSSRQYIKVIQSDFPTLSHSIAYNQLGCIAFYEQDLQGALDYFKNALTLNRQNEAIRYNYELTKKWMFRLGLKPNKEKRNKKDNKSGSKEKETKSDEEKSGMETTKKVGKGEEQKKEEPVIQPKKLEAIKLTREKAENILNALKNQEIQYLQQARKNKIQPSNHTQKPDW